MESERCCFSDCESVAEYLCSCAVVLCESHLSSHIRQNNKHSLMNLYDELTEQEIDHLKHFRGLDEVVLLKTAQIDKNFESKEAQFVSKIQKATDSHTISMERLFDHKDLILHSLQDIITNRRILSNSKIPIIDSLISLKEKKGLRDLETVVSFIEEYIQSLNSHDQKTAIGLYYGAVSILGEDMNRKEFNYPDDGSYYSANCLCLEDGSILFVTYRRVFKLWTETRTIEEIANVNVTRMYHALGYIDGNPAVIAGYYDSALNNVEVFDGTSWIEIRSLNYPRSSCSVVNFRNSTYAMGGYEGHTYGALDTIEKYSQDEWVILETKLPRKLAEIGTLRYGSKIILLGGTENNINYRNVYLWDGKDGWEELESLPKEAKFPVNVLLFSEETIYGYNEELELITYESKLLQT